MTRTLALLLLATSSAALAHPGDHAGGALHGFTHPFTGLDHLLAMLSVGVWAARLPSAARWQLPALFVCFMAIGAMLGGLALPFVEPMVALSVLVFALAASLGNRLPRSIAGGIVAFFALYHGHAHFTEMPDTSPAGFLGGMLLATALLHGAGVLVALAATKVRLLRA